MTEYARQIQTEITEMTGSFDEKKASLLEQYYHLVVDYNQKVNLTAITDREGFLQKHFLDSLAPVAAKNVSREAFGHGNSQHTEKNIRISQNVSRETMDVSSLFDNNCGVLKNTGAENREDTVDMPRKGARMNVSRETITAEQIKKETDREYREDARTDVSRETTAAGGSTEETADQTTDNVPEAVSRETIFKPGARVIDVGTGAGFPGIPLAVCRPDLKMTLMDSLNKRVAFLNEAIDTLQLNNCTATHARAEDLAHMPAYREKYDVCVSRAVAALPVLCEYCLPFVKKGGYFISYKASGSEQELKAAQNAVKILGGQLFAVDTVLLPGTDIERKLIIIRKTGPTPKKYPRKAGTPAKQPLK